MEKINVIIAEDVPCYIDGYMVILSKMLNVTVTDTFNNGLELIEYCKKNHNKVDFLLLDVRMPKMDGVDVLEYFKDRKWDIKTIMVSELYEEGFYDLCRKKLGLNGFISKRHFSSEHFEEAMKFINNSKGYFVDGPSPLKYDDKNYLEHKGREIMLTEREKDFIPLLSEYTLKEIAEKNEVSESTVKTTIGRAKEKFSVNSNMGLAKLFFNWK